MPRQSLAQRVFTLEEQMTALQELPRRVDDLTLQISQLRSEMRGEFSAIHREMASEAVTRRNEIAAEGTALWDKTAAQGIALRDEMAAQGTALRGEMAAQGAELRDEMAAQGGALRDEMAAQGTALRGEMAHQGTALQNEITQLRRDTEVGFTAADAALARAVDGLRREIVSGDEETRRQMRVLHEDVIGRIALLHESWQARRVVKGRRRKP